MKIERKSVWLWAAVCAGILFLGIWAVLRPENTARLADGRKVRVAALTYGTQHQYQRGGLPAKWFGRFLSAAFQRRLGWTTLNHTTAQPCLMVWLNWQTPRGSSAPAQYLSITDGKSETEPVHYKASNYPKQWEAVTGFEVTDFPRRDKQLGIVIYDRDNAFRPQKRAELWTTNPMRDRSPVRDPRPFPHVVKTNGVSMVFENLARSARKSTALCRVEGDKLNEWKVESLELRDDTGNWMQPTPVSCVRVGDYLHVTIEKPWWQSQKSYNWTVELSRTSGFDSNEVFAVAVTNLPPMGGQRTYGSAVHKGESTVFLAEINRNLPRGSPGYRQPVWSTELIVQVIPPTPGLEVSLLDAVAGTNATIRSIPAYAQPNGRRAYYLELPDDAEHLHLQFAMQRTVRVVFDQVSPPAQ